MTSVIESAIRELSEKHQIDVLEIEEFFRLEFCDFANERIARNSKAARAVVSYR